MTKRIISILMAIILSVSMCVTAIADDSLVIRENVIFDLQSLGILQGKGDGELALGESVTRAEFCAFVSRLIRAASVPYAGNFSDVTKADWYAGDVASLVGYGLINGNEHGEFCPDDYVTYTDAMKILVCALGYSIVAENEGGYPDGYRSVGTRIRLNDGISAYWDDYLTRGAVALMLYNALDIEILEPISYGDDLTYATSGKTYRGLFATETSRDSIYMAKGIVTADYYTYLLSPVYDIKMGEVQINGRLYNVGATNTADFLGMEVEYYYKEVKGGIPVIVSSRVTDETSVVTVDARDIDYIDSSVIKVYDSLDNKEIKLRLSANLNAVRNYQLMSKPLSFASGDDICKNGSVKIIDNTGDGLYDLFIIEDYTSYKVSRVSQKGFFIADGDLFDGNPFVNLDTDNDDIKIIIEDESGSSLTLADITEDDVVSILQSRDKSVIKCVLGKAAVKGRLDEISADRAYIDGEIYSFDCYYDDTVRVGSLVAVYIDFMGNIVSMEIDDSNGKNYAYILDSGVTTGISGAFCLKVLIPGKLKEQIEIDDSNEDQVVEIPVLKAYNSGVEVLTLASRINYDDVRMTGDEYQTAFSAAALSASPDNRLISYTVNSDGAVTSIESAQRIGDGNYKVFNGYENVFGKEGTQGFGITEQSGVVCVPENGGPGFSDDNYYASLLMNNGQRYQITGYDIDPEDSVASIVVITAPMDLSAGDVIGSSSKLAVVSCLSSVEDPEDGEVKAKLEFWSEGKKMSYFVADGSDASALACGMGFGDVFYYALNNNDEIYKLTKCELGSLGGELIYGDRGTSDTERSILGKITNIDYNIIDIYNNRRVNRVTVSLGDGVSPVSFDINRRNTPQIYVINPRTKTVTLGSIDDVSVGDGTVFAHIKAYSLKGIVVVR